jgi:hypothetical protein
MNPRLRKIMIEAGYAAPELAGRAHKLAELLVAKVLDEVAERSYYTGDTVWCDDLDRPWVELEFGFGKLAKIKDRSK